MKLSYVFLNLYNYRWGLLLCSDSLSSEEDPATSMAFLAFSPSSLVLFLLSSPSSPPSISFLTDSSTASLFTIISSPISIVRVFTPAATPMPSTLTINLSFRNCSAKNGQVSTGTPAQMASRHEFHPQWVTNPPTAEWERIATCGAQPLMTNPLPSVLSTNPSASHCSSAGDCSLDKRVVRGLQPLPYLDVLGRRNVRHAAEAGVDDASRRHGVQPGQALQTVVRGLVPSDSLHGDVLVLVVEAHGSYRPGLLPDGFLVALDVERLHLVEAVDNHTMACFICCQHLVPEPLGLRVLAEKRRLALGDLDSYAGADVAHTQEGEATGAVEDEPRHAQLVRDPLRPQVPHVGHDAARRRLMRLPEAI
ncbi:hypothetical protein Taro_046096 [Colocasia esculenta]|uniref:Uncharacterized protein n=1 Tax=Colocasia esculenta TaxID=4460 RepID=A0A843WNW0_COLES|nr:hypothetical protein [Colocasia esculenta]